MGNGKRDVGADNPGRADSSRDSDASSDSDSSDGSSANDTSAQPPARKYHALDMDMSVREALSGCTIIEYPVIEVALPSTFSRRDTGPPPLTSSPIPRMLTLPLVSFQS